MTEVRVTIAPVNLPNGPRDTMARLRGHGHFALLESAMVMPRQAEWSYIAGPGVATLYTDEARTRLVRDGHTQAEWADPFAALAEAAGCDGLQVNGERPDGMGFIGGWVGLLGYDLARHVEQLPERAAHDPVLPRQWWMAVDHVLAFHHPSGRWWQARAEGPADRWPWSTPGRTAVWDQTVARAAGPQPARGTWRAGPRTHRTDRGQFESGVQTIRDAIAAGDVLQVNLTRREDAAFDGDPWALYEDLAAAHPAPFGAFIEGPGFALASCSPERFLCLRGDLVESRPIKGTAPRGATPAADIAQREALAASVKDRAENLMIVDLMRNDFGRIAATGSVHVDALFALEPYASVWQMVSTVRARLKPGCGIAQLLRAAWPPGSMTGAPKVKALQIIEAMEPLRRGFYAGSAGYLGCDGALDLSVVIRSAVIAGDRVMVQFGGGIVADSQPVAEWAETVAKGQRLTGVLDAGACVAFAEIQEP